MKEKLNYTRQKPPKTVHVRTGMYPILPYGDDTSDEEALDYMDTFSKFSKIRVFGGFIYKLQPRRNVNPVTGEVMAVYKRSNRPKRT